MDAYPMLRLLEVTQCDGAVSSLQPFLTIPRFSKGQFIA
jgi:hypothetical protein